MTTLITAAKETILHVTKVSNSLANCNSFSCVCPVIHNIAKIAVV